MKNLHKGRVFLMLSLCLTLTGFSQSLYNGVGHIPASSQINWTNAGLLNPISAADNILYITDYTTGNYNERINDAMDDAQNLCGITIIYFPPGGYVFHQTVELRDNIIIQGAGAESTHFIFDNDKCENGFLIQGIGEQYDRTVTMDIAKKDSVIYVSNTTNYDVGDWILFKELANPDALEESKYHEPGQVSKITSLVTDNSITIKDEASKAYDDDYDLFLYKIDPVENVGIENLSIEREPDGNNEGSGSTIKFDYAVNCWVRGVETKDAFGRHITIRSSSHIEISGCYIHEAYSYCSGEQCGGEDGRGYGMVIAEASTNCLIENNILRKTRHALLINNGANCNVFTYNYARENNEEWPSPLGCTTIGADKWDLVLHGGYSYANLFEQNWVTSIVADDEHANNGPYNAFVRNRTTDGIARFKVMEHWSILGNFWETGGELNAIAPDFDNSPTVDIFGFTDPDYTIGLYHIQAFNIGNDISNYILKDVSYYYSSEPYFLTEGHNYYCTWPSLGPGITFGGPWQMIPAKYRWDYRNYGAKMTYNERSILPPNSIPTLNPTLT